MEQNQEESVGEQADKQVRRQKQPESGQFRLHVDGQAKHSYATYAAAEEAGMTIKKTPPLVHLVVYDLLSGVTRSSNCPKSESSGMVDVRLTCPRSGVPC